MDIQFDRKRDVCDFRRLNDCFPAISGNISEPGSDTADDGRLLGVVNGAVK